MARLTEADIFDCLTENFRKAAEHAEDLAKLPRKGPNYKAFREELQLIEGACRQAAAFRDDTRWLSIGLKMAACHKYAGDWLRGYKLPNGVRVTLAEGQRHPLFMELAEKLRAFATIADGFRTKATGQRGIILPPTQPGPHRDTRPVHITVPHHLRRSSGLIVPAGVGMQ